MFIPTRSFRVKPVLAAILLAAACCGAQAAGHDDDARVVPETFKFRYARADLASPAGADKVYRQLVREARHACRVLGLGKEIWRAALRSDCEADLIEKVVARVGAPELLARHEGTDHFRIARR